MPFLDKTGLAHLWDKIVARLNEKADKSDIPETLPNPNALAFTGAITDSYDGSEAKTVNIVGQAGTGTNAEVFNNSNTASGNYSHAEGNNTTASGGYSHAEGGGSDSAITITGDANATTYTSNKVTLCKVGRRIVYGDNMATITDVDAENLTITLDKTLSNVALTDTTVICKTGSVASGEYAHAEGFRTLATGKRSHAEGTNTTASGDHSHAEGYCATASGKYSHAEGEYTTATGNSAHAEGDSTTASGDCSHAEGAECIASGDYSHAEGYCATAFGDCSHAEGSGNNRVPNDIESSSAIEEVLDLWDIASFALAFGDCSHVEGVDCIAYGDCSHAEGEYTTATGDCSHAEGYNTTASGKYSHAEGDSTTASGSYSHAEGCYTTASNLSQHVQGEYNIVDTEGTSTTRGKYAHIVGNGTSSARSNAHTLDWNGNAWFAGTIKVGGTGQDDETAQEVALKSDITTPDWNAVEGEIGHVLNRTHYETVSENVLYDRSYTFTQYGHGIIIDVNIVTGQDYKVVFDDITYYMTAKSKFDDFGIECIYIGEINDDWSNNFTSYPFVITRIDGESKSTVYVNNVGTHSIKIGIETKTVHQLDEKYIPDTVARKADVPHTEGTGEVLFDGIAKKSSKAQFEQKLFASPIVDGRCYTVELDGVTYIRTAYTDAEGSVTIGALYDAENQEYDYTDTPFVIFQYDGLYYCIGSSVLADGNHTYKIIDGAIHKLDEKYLPDTVATKEDLEALREEIMSLMASLAETQSYLNI